MRTVIFYLAAASATFSIPRAQVPQNPEVYGTVKTLKAIRSCLPEKCTIKNFDVEETPEAYIVTNLDCQKSSAHVLTVPEAKLLVSKFHLSNIFQNEQKTDASQDKLCFDLTKNKELDKVAKLYSDSKDLPQRIRHLTAALEAVKDEKEAEAILAKLAQLTELLNIENEALRRAFALPFPSRTVGPKYRSAFLRDLAPKGLVFDQEMLFKWKSNSFEMHFLHYLESMEPTCISKNDSSVHPRDSLVRFIDGVGHVTASSPFADSESAVTKDGLRRVKFDEPLERDVGKFVIDEDYDILLGRHGCHADILRGKNVFGAGIARFDESGVLVQVNNASGHYTPSISLLTKSVQNLQSKNKLKQVKVESHMISARVHMSDLCEFVDHVEERKEKYITLKIDWKPVLVSPDDFAEKYSDFCKAFLQFTVRQKALEDRRDKRQVFLTRCTARKLYKLAYDSLKPLYDPATQFNISLAHLQIFEDLNIDSDSFSLKNELRLYSGILNSLNEIGKLDADVEKWSKVDRFTFRSHYSNLHYPIQQISETVDLKDLKLLKLDAIIDEDDKIKSFEDLNVILPSIKDPKVEIIDSGKSKIVDLKNVIEKYIKEQKEEQYFFSNEESAILNEAGLSTADLYADDSSLGNRLREQIVKAQIKRIGETKENESDQLRSIYAQVVTRSSMASHLGDYGISAARAMRVEEELKKTAEAKEMSFDAFVFALGEYEKKTRYDLSKQINEMFELEQIDCRALKAIAEVVFPKMTVKEIESIVSDSEDKSGRCSVNFK